jgi:hypothetical protein
MNDIERAIKYLKESAIYANRHWSEKIDDKDEIIKLFNVAIESLEKQLNSGWIPVSERLPAIKDGSLEYNELCLVTVNDKMRTYTYIAYYSSCSGFMGLFGGDWNNYVTAWQPLPEKYTED